MRSSLCEAVALAEARLRSSSADCVTPKPSYCEAKAEEVRFELTIGLRLCRFSKPVPSTTQPLFHIFHYIQMEAVCDRSWLRGSLTMFAVWNKAVCSSPISATLPSVGTITFFVFLAKNGIIIRVKGPIVYRLGHELFKLGSRVRLPVGS